MLEFNCKHSMPAKPFVNQQGGFTVFLKFHSDICVKLQAALKTQDDCIRCVFTD